MPRPQRKKKNLSSNIIVPKKKVAKFSCSHCGKTYKLEKSFLKHKSEAHNIVQPKLETEIGLNEFVVKKRSLPCKLCQKKFKFIENYRKHLKNEHSTAPGSVSCTHCTVRCPNQELLNEHVKKAHEKGDFACEHCGQTFVRNYHVIRHLEQSGCDGKQSKVFECEICLTKFTRKDNLLVHLRTHLTRKFTCKHCPFVATRFNKYVRHVQEEHLEPKYVCDICDKVLGSRGAIAKHLEIHGEKKYACEVCNYQTFTIEVMKRHVLRHTAEKPYKCSQCDASFIQNSQLRRHLAKHDGFKCQLCSDTFTSAGLLNKHLKETPHKGLEGLMCPFSNCTVSKLRFASEESLKEHITTHTEKEYVCEVCTKSFRNEITLRHHERTHWLERPRRCMYCVNARAYIRGDMLLRHVRTKHPAVFAEHLAHVREVMGVQMGNVSRVTQSEMSSVLSLLDAVSERILEQGGDGRVLYAGMQDDEPKATQEEEAPEASPLLSEAQLASSLQELLARLIDDDTLACFGWPDKSVDEILEKVIEQCGQTPADKSRWSRVQCLRENAKHLFLHVVEDKAVGRMLATHTIDQVVTHLLKVSAADDDEVPEPEADQLGKTQELVVEFTTY